MRLARRVGCREEGGADFTTPSMSLIHCVCCVCVHVCISMHVCICASKILMHIIHLSQTHPVSIQESCEWISGMLDLQEHPKHYFHDLIPKLPQGEWQPNTHLEVV